MSNVDLNDISLAEASELLFNEARCLDESRFEDWLDLFTEQGVYWIPSQRDQTDPVYIPSIIYEDRNLLAMRASRLAHPRTYRINSMPRTTHLVGNIMMARGEPDGSGCRVLSTVLVHEYRDGNRRLFSGLCTHDLQREGGVLKIRQKRFDMVDADGVHSAFLIPL